MYLKLLQGKGLSYRLKTIYIFKRSNFKLMNAIKNPYLSRVRIKNFRNFLDVDVELDHKQVIIGENNVGKTNFLRAIQLILDKEFSDNDRQLTESDFHDSLDDPMLNGEEIEIILNIKGYEHNSKLVAQFVDAVIESDPPTLEFRYKFFPTYDDQKNIVSYKYDIFKGNANQVRFTSEDRSFINIYVIRALRDVERELKANKHSPLYKLVKKYDIQKEELEEIAELMKGAADQILELDEIGHIKKTIQQHFSLLSGIQKDSDVTLRTFDMDIERLLYSIQVYMGIEERPINELSLGLANILYVSLMLILLKDRTILPIIRTDNYAELHTLDIMGVLDEAYTVSVKGNYILNDDISAQQYDQLYSFFDETTTGSQQSFTILAVEEPEAHLHPLLQRLIYREVLHKSDTSVIFTSHSTFITSVSPLSTIVHIRRLSGSSQVFSTFGLNLDSGEQRDIERYIDAKRGEIYFGKAVILAEGITEEYILPAAANLLGTSLDDKGIIVCNIHSTNFKPYIQIMDALHIPWVLFTDGDYYETEEIYDEEKATNKTVNRFHIMSTRGDAHYAGNENISRILQELEVIEIEDIPSDFSDQDVLFRSKGAFIGGYTLEVDMMEKADQPGTEVLKKVYAELTGGGKTMLANFAKIIEEKKYWKALDRIEQNTSKGRFAQRLSLNLTIGLVPEYVSKGIAYIVEKVAVEHE